MTAASSDDARDGFVSVDRVAITYEGERDPALAGATFTVARGETVLLLGPSGSGKSTLALSLNGLIPHAVHARVEGAIIVDGLDTTRTPVSRLSTRVGMVFQDPDAQLVTGTLLDEVAFGPENLCLPVSEVLARAEDALRRVGLWERRRENPDSLSGGGRQRLAIACALALRSPLLVFDEPTANLDPAGIEEVYAVLAELAATGDHAIVLIEHNLDAAIALTDRVVVLDADGRTFADGPTDDVLRGQADDLKALGVWLPSSTLAAMRLRDAGWSIERLPLTPAELRTSVDAVEPPAASAPATVAAEPAGMPAAAAPEVAIEARRLSVTRARHQVLHDVDVAVRRGEFVAIVGPNGAGKTTLLQALSGVIPVPRGTVRIGGLDPARASGRAVSRQVGFVFQNPEHQFVAHSVYEELAHGLRRQRLPDDEVRRRVHEVLARFGLEARAGVHPFLLSGGQKRRLSVGTALVAGAPVLCLDEPTFGQDRARADELLRLLRELNEEGTTIVVVTHDMQLVAEYADRTVVVAEGRIVTDAATASVLADEELLARTGLRPPPLRAALAGSRHPQLAAVTRLADLTRGRVVR